ncbi:MULTISPECIES: NAD(P)-dependent oxidoreductase [unclassified Aeromicrobium]|uniref:NAD(P)-dependent oxidoreductase n=1 Tax=unclassified Aeromicrobium TaxID=2633570 RepID=UPI00396B0C29
MSDHNDSAHEDRVHDVLMVGLGAMGGPIAANLGRARDVRLAGFDADVAGRVPGAGTIRRMASVREGVVADGVVITCLPGIQQVEQVISDIIEGEVLPAVVVDISTSDPQRSREVALLLARHGVDFLDAPVARGRVAAAAGELLMMVGGSTEVLERLRPILRVVASDIVHCGDVGAGQTVKILNNMVLMMNVNAVVDAMTIADRHGLDPTTVVRVLRSGSAGSFALSGEPGRALETGSFPSGKFAVDYALKDARLAEALAGDDITGALRAARELLEAASAEGLGDAYYPAVVQTRLGRPLTDGYGRGGTA